MKCKFNIGQKVFAYNVLTEVTIVDRNIEDSFIRYVVSHPGWVKNRTYSESLLFVSEQEQRNSFMNGKPRLKPSLRLKIEGRTTRCD